MARLYLRRALTGFVAADEPILDKHGRNPSRVVIGRRVGKLTVLSFAYVGVDRQRRFLCVCDCGKKVTVRSNGLSSGRTKSCGCLRFENEQNKTHGMSSKSNRTYRIWANMRDRCNRPANPAYKYYGGRGISICERWNDFAKFIADMGTAPPDRSIDRIDNNRGYEPTNCRWATALEQGRNRRNVKNRG